MSTQNLISSQNSNREWRSGNQLLQKKDTLDNNSAHFESIHSSNTLDDDSYLADLNISICVGGLKEKNEAKVREVLHGLY